MKRKRESYLLVLIFITIIVLASLISAVKRISKPIEMIRREKVKDGNAVNVVILIMKTTVGTERYYQRIESSINKDNGWANKKNAKSDIKLIFLNDFEECNNFHNANNKNNNIDNDINQLDNDVAKILQEIPNAENKEHPIMDSPHYKLCAPIELRNSKSMKMAWALKRIRDIYPQAKWILKGDEITYFILDNLRHLISTNPLLRDPWNKPIYTGNVLIAPSNEEFVSGGAGMLMSVNAVDKFLKAWYDEDEANQGFERKYVRGSSFYQTSEDIAISKCMLTIGIRPLDLVNRKSGDDESDIEIFNAFGPVRLLRKDLDDWFVNLLLNDHIVFALF